jgi:hypothetical protein
MTRYVHRHTLLRALDQMSSGNRHSHDAGSDLLASMDPRDGLAASVSVVRDLIAREAERSGRSAADVLMTLYFNDETEQMEDANDEQG